jgi:hypothetical protein
MQLPTVALAAGIYAGVLGPAAPAEPAPYSAVEVDPFAVVQDVALPPDYQTALMENIAREISLAFETMIIVRPGDPPPFGHAVLRISGTVIRFQPANPAKRSLIGFHTGAAMLQARVRFADASTGQVLLIREVKGASESVAKKIVKFCITSHWLESK